jgi:Calx-beta domain/Carboxypeptidase regulatory-like domain
LEALSERDFQPATGTLTFAPGTTKRTANVTINGDIVDEVDETFRLLLSNPTNATVFVNNVVTIVDDDEPPAISIRDVSVMEGTSRPDLAIFNVTLSVGSGKFIRVLYATADGTATAGTDYIPPPNFSFIEFNPGETNHAVAVRLVADTTVEAEEHFFVNLSNPSNATILDAQAIGTILDDDSPPLLTISGRVRDESGNGVGDVTITLSGSQSATTQTVANGQFFLRDLPAGGNYLVTPSKAGHLFEPVQLRFDNLSADADTADFISISAPATLRFSDANFTSGEGAGHATLSVTREGNTDGTVTVEFSTVDDPASVPCDPTRKRPDGTSYPQGTAYARCDYATTIDTLTFAPGESTKEIHVPLVDDVHVEGDETVQVRLQNVTGAATLVEAQSSATLIINDNDITAGQPNPIFSTAFFVRMHYLDFLSREPEPNEPWSRVLNNCANPFNLDPQNPSAACDQLIVSQSFFGSAESRMKGFFVYNFYRVVFERRPEYTEIIPDMRSVTGQTSADTYARRAAYPVLFTQRAEFRTRYDALSDTAFVNALLDRYGFQQITTPDPQQPEAGIKVVLTRAELINRLGAAAGSAQALTRAQVLRAVVESDEVGAAEYKGAFVAMQYYGYLRRTPEESGYQAWLRVITEDPNNVRIMVNGFMNSTEYRLRFGQP